MKRRVAVLISGRGSNLSALLHAARAPDYPAAIALVLSNRPDAAGLALAAAAGNSYSQAAAISVTLAIITFVLSFALLRVIRKVGR